MNSGTVSVEKNPARLRRTPRITKGVWKAKNKDMRNTTAQIDTSQYDADPVNGRIEPSHDIADPAHGDSEAWAQINHRRLDLIEKQLSPGELALLDRLNATMVRHVDAIAPLPWGMLNELKAAARELGISVE